MSETVEVPPSGDLPAESANMGGDAAPEETFTPHPLAGQGEDISPDKDGGVLKAIKVKGDEAEQDRPAKGDRFTFTTSVPFSPASSQVIKGWDVGVATMRRGEIAVLTCKPEYAYGSKGQIPADSTLVFEVELFDWKGEDVSKDSDGSIIKRTLVVGEGDTAKEDALVETVYAWIESLDYNNQKQQANKLSIREKR
ncbi:putative peptidyl-prolyl cis-trans isomerase FKBP4 [Apostichopus japonicus]|uniref:peptidylprolyl isomerase n=1 Tax=Stichopus japonicus TaxID=307972 RepID=A0A2G8L831_STIJA|nr:putative peptidyl-prolyl cis-trans isomerase FKBP4 [Apostichopus japonicus]